MRRVLVVLGAVVGLMAWWPGAAGADTGIGYGGGEPGTSLGFEQVGHDSLYRRGMNAALAIYGDYVYVGNRTDASRPCSQTGGTQPCHASANTHVHPGILIVNTRRPSRLRTVGEIGPPHAGLPGITTRELRVWPRQKLLVVMTFRCSAAIHDCAPGTDATFGFGLDFYSLEDPAHPRFLSTYVPTSQAGLAVKPHEMFLWQDPRNRDRALLYLSTPTGSVDPKVPNLMVVDISAVARGGAVREIAEGNWNQLFPGAENAAAYDQDLALHSMTPRADGGTTYLAYLRGGTLVLDTSRIADDEIPPGTVESLNDDLLTPIANRAVWGAGNQCAGHTAAGCAESHTAAPVPGRPFVLNVDEVYGTLTLPSFGWPWGWVRLIDVGDPSRPDVVGEYKIVQNTLAYTPDPATEAATSYSSHNPTILPRLALDAWHSGGLQAIDIRRPRRPAQAGWFSPTPLGSVATEDPALTGGPNKTAVWSYPIIRNGLIYVVDIRNGLYVLRYTGKRARQVRRIRFLEGNSNLGDALALSGDGAGEGGRATGRITYVARSRRWSR
jgi:hypothetical protein